MSEKRPSIPKPPVRPATPRVRQVGLSPLQEKVLEVYSKQMCNLAATCRKTNISRNRFNDWRAKYPEFDAMVVNAKEALIDDAETVLYKRIYQDNCMISTIFYLKTKGKSRGYVEKTEVSTTISADPVQIYLPDNNRGNPPPTGLAEPTDDVALPDNTHVAPDDIPLVSPDSVYTEPADPHAWQDTSLDPDVVEGEAVEVSADTPVGGTPTSTHSDSNSDDMEGELGC